MTRTVLLLAAAASSAAATGCGPGQAKTPASPLPAIQKGDTPPVAARDSAGPVRAPQPPRP